MFPIPLPIMAAPFLELQQQQHTHTAPAYTPPPNDPPPPAYTPPVRAIHTEIASIGPVHFRAEPGTPDVIAIGAVIIAVAVLVMWIYWLFQPKYTVRTGTLYTFTKEPQATVPQESVEELEQAARKLNAQANKEMAQAELDQVREFIKNRAKIDLTKW